MAKLTLTDISTAGVDWITLINTVNANNALIEAALENTLSRDGTAPNYMNDVLDMNDIRIINVPTPVDSTDAVNKAYVDSEIDAIVLASGGGGGVSAHGDLTGLDQDDHTQYYNETRLLAYTGFDSRYYTETEIDSLFSSLSIVAGDIDSTGATDGYVLTADGLGNTAWEVIPGIGGGSVAELNDVGDVTITSVATGELIMRSGTSWINRTLAEAGVAAASHTHSATAITSGTMAPARLGSGTPSSSTFLRGDSTWASPTFTPTFSGVRVYKTGAQIISNNTYEAVTFNTENYDSDSYWPGSGSVFTVPDDGYYHIDAGIRWDTSTSGQRAIRIVANSVNVAESTVTPTGSINTCLSTSCDVYLTAGQTIVIYAGLYNGSGDRSLNVSGQTTFCSIHKIA